MGKAENSVVSAVQQLCQVYSVPCFRIQSRVIEVADKRKPGGTRPFFVGMWKDQEGVSHTGGMADLLLHPRINFQSNPEGCFEIHGISIVVPLWIETKSKSGQSKEQVAFQKYIESIGASYLVVRESADPLIAWFRKHGVIR